ncbi:MAG: hypothetical protein M1819_001536 [Sarea resinae]|nr:MAG: hypothetical protein M1819_001536 [Sarea resinae]
MDSPETLKVNARLDKLKAILPQEPYLLSIVSKRPYIVDPAKADDWRRGTTFGPEDEHLQYSTFLARRPDDGLLMCSRGDLSNAVEEPGVAKGQTRESTVMADASGPASRKPAPKPAKKISLAEYKNRRAKGPLQKEEGDEGRDSQKEYLSQLTGRINESDVFSRVETNHAVKEAANSTHQTTKSPSKRTGTPPALALDSQKTDAQTEMVPSILSPTLPDSLIEELRRYKRASPTSSGHKKTASQSSSSSTDKGVAKRTQINKGSKNNQKIRKPADSAQAGQRGGLAIRAEEGPRNGVQNVHQKSRQKSPVADKSAKIEKVNKAPEKRSRPAENDEGKANKRPKVSNETENKPRKIILLKTGSRLGPKSDSKPRLQPPTDSKPPAEATARAEVDPTAKTAAKPPAKATAKSTTEPTVKPVAKSTAQPTVETATEQPQAKWRQEIATLSGLARELKHKADRLHRTEKEDKGQRAAALLSFESILCYMLAFEIRDFDPRTKQRMASQIDPWKELLPLFGFLNTKLVGRAHLIGLSAQLEAIIREVIHDSTLDLNASLPASGNLDTRRSSDSQSPQGAGNNRQDGTMFKENVSDNSRKLKILWLKAAYHLPVNALSKRYRKTWDDGLDKPLLKSFRAHVEEPGKYQGGYYLPLSSCSQVIEGVRFGFDFLHEYAANNKLSWAGHPTLVERLQ